MIYSYKFRIYPTAEQEVLIQKTFGCCRFIYNYFLAERKKVYEERGATLNFYACDKLLTKLKRKNDWLCEPDKNSLKYSLRDLDCAYKKFFDGIKKGQKAGYPKFKSKKNNQKSYRTALFANGLVLNAVQLTIEI